MLAFVSRSNNASFTDHPNTNVVEMWFRTLARWLIARRITSLVPPMFASRIAW